MKIAPLLPLPVLQVFARMTKDPDVEENRRVGVDALVADLVHRKQLAPEDDAEEKAHDYAEDLLRA